jgi:steroid 5-alpha reductase family enzyme
MQNPSPTFTLWELAGGLLWLAAVGGEWVADRQLVRFRADPVNRGRTCRDGLWRYSRHPNYFFEALHWWAYVLMGVGVPFGWVTLLGPLLMTVALLKISGFPLAEAQALASRGEDYRNYQRTTSAFIPWFPKQAGR